MGSDDAELYDVTGPIHWGDSGGPLVHVVQGILAKAAAAGFPVTLKTV